MAVMINTSVGDLVVDLFTDMCPLASKNFLKLCKMKYYNNCLFHSVQKDFIVQTGDPTGTGVGGDSIYKFLYGEQARFFENELHPKLKHDKVGIVAMASAGENANASQFYITTRAELDYLDGKHTVFGEVAEGLETLMRINEAFVDEKFRPYKNIRIKHTHILDDPFDDPPSLADMIPDRSPALKPPAEGEEVRLEDDWVPMDEKIEPEELDKSLRRKEAQSRAVVLEMIGDIPEAEMKPPENVLFVCKLNPVTEEGDLELIFGRFGKVVSADIIRDYKTGDSLCYAFIEFEGQEACEAAYFKMDNVLIDDRRIHVDFSQSVSRLWNRYRRFGTKEGGAGGVNFAPGQGKGKGCFKCGEVGHFAKDCPNDSNDQKSSAPDQPKYSIRDTGGQRGSTGRSYDMVFEDEENVGDGSGRTKAADRQASGSRGLPVKVTLRGDEEDDRKRAQKYKGGREMHEQGHRSYTERQEMGGERLRQDSRREKDSERHRENAKQQRGSERGKEREESERNIWHGRVGRSGRVPEDVGEKRETKYWERGGKMEGGRHEGEGGYGEKDTPKIRSQLGSRPERGRDMQDRERHREGSERITGKRMQSDEIEDTRSSKPEKDIDLEPERGRDIQDRERHQEGTGRRTGKRMLSDEIEGKRSSKLEKDIDLEQGRGSRWDSQQERDRHLDERALGVAKNGRHERDQDREGRGGREKKREGRDDRDREMLKKLRGRKDSGEDKRHDEWEGGRREGRSEIDHTVGERERGRDRDKVGRGYER